MTFTRYESPSIEVAALIDTIMELRPQLAANGAIADRDNTDSAANFALIRESGVNRLLVPRSHGGAFWNGEFFDGWGTYVRAATELTTGDGPTGQNWATTALVIREVFASGLPESTKTEVARRVRDEGLRLVASNSEAGSPQKVVARKTSDGVILSGTKTFNSNSGGLGIANVAALLSEEGAMSPHHVLVELNHPDVELHHDWDVMGQRGTYSQSITYHDVFVPDGWHYPSEGRPPALFGAVMILHAGVQQGIGEGALHAAVEYVRTLNRGTMPQFDTAADDLLVLRRIGEISSKLSASKAMLLQSADQLELRHGSDDIGKVIIDGYRAKVACLESSLFAAQELYELTGARSLANKNRFDRFWRNARSFATHDPTDAKNIYVGMYEVTGELPPMSALLRV